jgi:hypothetical protein
MACVTPDLTLRKADLRIVARVGSRERGDSQCPAKVYPDPRMTLRRAKFRILNLVSCLALWGALPLGETQPARVG